jgi:hypothetical protein
MVSSFSFLFIDHSVAIFFLVKKMYNLVLLFYEEYVEMEPRTFGTV